jgi:hypothetical protein
LSPSPGAKTTAYINLASVDFAIVAIRHGGEHVVRQYLEDMAIRLSWSEPNLEKILKNPVFKLLEPLVNFPRWRKRHPAGGLSTPCR